VSGLTQVECSLIIFIVKKWDVNWDEKFNLLIK
jgi:hypothetical protein